MCGHKSGGQSGGLQPGSKSDLISETKPAVLQSCDVTGRLRWLQIKRPVSSSGAGRTHAWIDAASWAGLMRCVRNVLITHNDPHVSVIIQSPARTRISAALERSAGGDPASDVSGFSLTSLNASLSVRTESSADVQQEKWFLHENISPSCS